MSKVCSQIVLKCLCLARIGRLDILWSANKLAGAVTKWTRDRRLALIVMWVIRHSIVDWDRSKTQNFAGDFEDTKSTSGGTVGILGSRTFVPVSSMCKKQTSVSHCSTESEVISLDAGLRMDGIPALDPWDLHLKYCTLPQANRYRVTCCATKQSHQHKNEETPQPKQS